VMPLRADGQRPCCPMPSGETTGWQRGGLLTMMLR
jgi:hypothetical protein